MKSRDLIILGAVVFGLVALVLIKYISKDPTPRVESAQQLVSVPDLTERARRIELALYDAAAGQDKRIVLERSAGIWRLATLYGAPAEETTVSGLLTALSGLAGRQRSQDAGLFADYGIGEQQALRISVADEAQTIVDLYVGARRAGWQTNFVRQVSGDAVYAVDENILSLVGVFAELDASVLSAEHWFQRRVVAFAPEDIAAVSIHRNGRLAAHIVRAVDMPAWRFARTRPIALAEEKVSGYFSGLAGISANTVLSVDALDSADAPVLSIELQRTEGSPVIIAAYPAADNESVYSVRVNEASYLYTVARHTLDTFAKNDGDFFIDNPLSIQEDQLNAVRVEDVSRQMGVLFERRIAQPDAPESPPRYDWVCEQAAVAPESITAMVNALVRLKLRVEDEQEMPLLVDRFRLTLLAADSERLLRISQADSDGEKTYYLFANTASALIVDSALVTQLEELLAMVALPELTPAAHAVGSIDLPAPDAMTVAEPVLPAAVAPASPGKKKRTPVDKKTRK